MSDSFSEFNHESRKKNVLRSSFTNFICKIIQLALGLGYRSVFLKILTVSYLGLNGLFSNVLGLLSLADLGISDAIMYRLYEPISRDDTHAVGRYMRFFRKTYFLIALVITLLGASLLPFLGSFIHDGQEIPPDVNLTVIYLLFLAQTVSSYLFSYKFMLLYADQKQHLSTLLSTAITALRYGAQVALLLTTGSYTWTLVAGIGLNILLNYLGSLWITSRYPEVFRQKEDLPEDTRRGIFKDTFASMLHKVGMAVLTSTDNILLTKYIGLAVTGIFSNYSMIITNVSGLAGSLFSSLTPSFGNAHASLDREGKYRVFKKALFLNFWVISAVTVCIYSLIDDFILIWLGKKLFLDHLTVTLLCAQFYLEGFRYVTGAYTQASGLFRLDKPRPIIEAVLNIVISIVCLQQIGVAGIFLGTILSHMATAFWRTPMLLCRHVFGPRLKDYWLLWGKYALLTAASAWLAGLLKTAVFGSGITLFSWIAAGLLCLAVYTALHTLLFCRDENFRQFLTALKNKAFRR